MHARLQQQSGDCSSSSQVIAAPDINRHHVCARVVPWPHAWTHALKQWEQHAVNCGMSNTGLHCFGHVQSGRTSTVKPSEQPIWQSALQI